MNTHAWLAIVAIVFSIGTPSVTQAQSARARDLRRFLAQTAAVTPPATSTSAFVRIALPERIRVACNDSLDALYVLSATGEDVPFVRFTPRRSATEVLGARSDAELRDYRVERIDARAVRETMTIPAPPQYADANTWVLDVQSAVTTFQSTITITDAAGNELHRGTIFRLRDGRTQLSITLPVQSVSEARVTLEGPSPALEPRFGWTVLWSPGADDVDAIRVESTQTSLPDLATHQSRTRFVMTVPVGVELAGFRLTTASPFFRREVLVSSGWSTPGIPADQRTLIANGTWMRAQGIDSQGDHFDLLFGETLRDVGRSLAIEIDNGTNAPLASVEISALSPRPSIAFRVPDGGARLFFGGHRLTPRRHDVNALASVLPFDGANTDDARVARQLERLPLASVGPVEANPTFDNEPGLAFAWQRASKVDRSRFSHSRTISVPSGNDGVTKHRLGPYVIGNARLDLGDIRVVDGSDHQYPYILRDRNDRPPTTVTVNVARQTHDDAGTHYFFALPVAVTPTSMRLAVDTRKISRRFTVTAHQGQTIEQQIGTQSIERWDAAGTAPPDSIVLPLSMCLGGSCSQRADMLELTVDDGDEEPLAIKSAVIEVPDWDLLLIAPPGEYTLLVGDPKTVAPTYDAASFGDLVRRVSAPDVAPTALIRTAGYTPHVSAEASQRLWVWLALGIAVLAMLAVIAHVARSLSTEAPPPTNASKSE